MAVNLFPEASKYATKRKLIYERKTPKGTIQIWKENGKYRQVFIPISGNATVSNCSKAGTKVRCESITYDLKTNHVSKPSKVARLLVDTGSRVLLPPIIRFAVPKETLMDHGETLVEDGKKAVGTIKQSFSNYIVNPLFKWALIGAGAYLAFIWIKKQIEDR